MAANKRMQLWPFEKEKGHFVKKLCVGLRHIEDLRRVSQRQNRIMRRMQLKAGEVKNKINKLKEGLTSDDTIFIERTVSIFLELINIVEGDLKIYTDRLDADKETLVKALSEMQSHYLRLIRALNRIESVSRPEMRNMAMPTMFWTGREPPANANALEKLWKQGKYEQRVNSLRQKIDSFTRDMRRT